MNPPTTVGRHPLATRFTANVRIHYIEPPTIEEMNLIYTEYARASIFQSKKLGSNMS
jgi:dynein heavy chain 2